MIYQNTISYKVLFFKSMMNFKFENNQKYKYLNSKL